MPKREFPPSPLVGVGAVIIQENRVLLVQRGTEPAKGQWSIPGGLIDIGETLREAVAREAREETGLLVEPIELIELLDRIYRDGERVRYHYVIADYLCRVTGGTLQAASDADAARWVEHSQWNSHSFHPVDKDTSPGTPDSALGIDPVTVRVIEAAWQRAQTIRAQTIRAQTGETL